MGKGCIGKRAAADESASISAPVTVYRAEKRSKSSCVDEEYSHSLKSLNRAWNSFETNVDEALRELRLPSFHLIENALTAKPPHEEIVAVCILMGTASVGGDRATIFDSVLDHVEQRHGARILRLRDSSQSPVSQIDRELREHVKKGPTIVAMDDAEFAYEGSFRDIIYSCGTVAKEFRDECNGEKLASRDEDGPATSLPRVSLIVGLSSSTEAFHSSLGVQESSMVATVAVEMPGAVDCLTHLVDKVLSKQEHGVIFSREVYEIIESEYCMRDRTISMLMRIFKQVYTLHFLQQKLAPTFVYPSKTLQDAVTRFDSDTRFDVDQNSELIREASAKALSPKVCAHLRSHTPSVETILRDTTTTDSALQSKAIRWYCGIRKYRRLRYLAELVVWQLVQIIGSYEFDLETHLGCKKEMFRSYIHKALLPSTSSVLLSENVLRLIRVHFKQAPKQRLLVFIDSMLRESASVEEPQPREVTRFTEDLGNVKKSINLAINTPASTDNIPVSTVRVSQVQRRAKGAAAAREHRRAQLLSASAESNPQQQHLIAARQNVSRIFDEFIECIPDLSKLPMHESVFFHRQADVIKISGGAGGPAEPRYSMLNSLRDPSKFLGRLTSDQIPDTAITYQVLCEGGRLVNLYDWYSSFSAIRSTQGGKDNSDSNDSEEYPSETLIQARFARACSELEFIGLIKHTKRKTDHVARLVFD